MTEPTNDLSRPRRRGRPTAILLTAAAPAPSEPERLLESVARELEAAAPLLMRGVSAATRSSLCRAALEARLAGRDGDLVSIALAELLIDGSRNRPLFAGSGWAGPANRLKRQRAKSTSGGVRVNPATPARRPWLHPFDVAL